MPITGTLQPAVTNHGLESGEDLLKSQIAGRTEQDERVGWSVSHDASMARFYGVPRSTCPPN
jgi:hypothetical protein